MAADGFEPRLLRAAAALSKLHPSAPGPPSTAYSGTCGSARPVDGPSEQQQQQGWQVPRALGELLKLRCQQLLGQYPTTWQQDAVWLAEQGSAASSPIRTAVQFRMSKKAILWAAIERLGR